MKAKVFISYDVNGDESLLNSMMNEAKKLSLEIISTTKDTNLNGDYSLEVGSRIRESDDVIFLCDSNTNNSLEQSEEMRIAREEGKSYYLIGLNDKAKKPNNARNYDIIYELKDLKNLLENK